MLKLHEAIANEIGLRARVTGMEKEAIRKRSLKKLKPLVIARTLELRGLARISLPEVSKQILQQEGIQQSVVTALHEQGLCCFLG